jgi:hypothetical protein
MKLYHRHTLSSVTNTTQISFWCRLADTWKNTTNFEIFKFRNNDELSCVQEETLEISVNTKHFNTVGEFIREFPLSKIGGTCKIINICGLLRAATHFFERTDRCLTKTLRGLSHLFWWLLLILQSYQIMNSLLKKNQTYLKPKIKQIRWYRIAGPGAFVLISRALGPSLVTINLQVTDTLKGPHEEMPQAASGPRAVGIMFSFIM